MTNKCFFFFYPMITLQVCCIIEILLSWQSYGNIQWPKMWFAF